MSSLSVFHIVTTNSAASRSATDSRPFVARLTVKGPSALGIDGVLYCQFTKKRGL